MDALNDFLKKLRSAAAEMRNRDIRIFWIGQCFAMTGIWMLKTSIIWDIYTITDSPMKIGLIGLIEFLPVLCFSLAAGAVIDYFPRRTVLIATQSFFFIETLILFVLSFFDAAGYWTLLALYTLLSMALAIDMTARLSYYISLMGIRNLMIAVSVNTTLMDAARTAGPAASGWLMQHMGFSLCFLLTTPIFAFVVFSLRKIQSPDSHTRGRRIRIVREIGAGIKYIASSRVMLISALIVFIVSLFALNESVILPVFARTVLDRGAEAYAGLLSANAMGTLAGGLVAGVFLMNGRGRGLLFWSAAGLAGIQIFLAPVRSYDTAFWMMILLGVCKICFLNAGNAVFHLNTPNSFRGRIISIYSFLNQSVSPLGGFFAGTVMQYAGGVYGFPVCGLCAALSLWLVFRSFRSAFADWFKPERRGV